MTTLEKDTVWVGANAAVAASATNPSDRIGSSVGTRIKLVLVEDDPDYREAASAELGELGFEVRSFAAGDEMLEYFARNNDADVIVLDWKLPGGLGIDLLPKLHDRGIRLPVVFLTGMPATAYESAALDRGALDFVDKARGVPILAKRIRLILDSHRRARETPARAALSCGKLLLRPDVRRAFWDNQDVNLTVTEFNIVHLIVSHAGEHVTYRAIYDCVHHAGFVAGNGDEGYRTNVRSSIKRIRNKFRTLDATFSEIENFPAYGYRWRTAPVQAA
ncbi:MAG TPA: response regulator transcription factor [Stellaceae bacterium]|jgi:two-component system, OmpR family, response regulator ChvI|nr:response regulator transcription factor [Stellaceae bacterium]